MLVDWLGGRIPAHVCVALGPIGLYVAVDFTRQDAAVDEAATVSPFDSVGGVAIGSLVMPRRKYRSILPTAPGRVDVIVQGDHPGVEVNAIFTKQVRLHAADDAPQVFSDDRVVEARRHQLAQLAEFLPIQQFAALAPLQDLELKRIIRVLLEPVLDLVSLLLERALILLGRVADPDWHEDSKGVPVLGHQRRIQPSV